LIAGIIPTSPTAYQEKEFRENRNDLNSACDELSRVEVGLRDKEVEDEIRRFAVSLEDSTAKRIFDINTI